MRVALGLEYDGSAFHGWQIQQQGVRTVQSCLEKAIARVANHPVTTVCAGRTDAGVHAIGQVVHFETHAHRSPDAWIMGTNSNLPADIGVQWARLVPGHFHARFSALARRYRYVILNRPYRSALQRQRAAWCYRRLDAARMATAGHDLVGEHDFTSFRAVGCQAKSPVRQMTAMEIQRRGDYIALEVEANAFLHHMVRNIVGVLMAIGSGDRPIEWAREVLAVRDRGSGGVTAPPQGLYLLAVRYGDEFGLPEVRGPELCFG
jgi:tRNA pseudouridine38-40 synthase